MLKPSDSSLAGEYLRETFNHQFQNRPNRSVYLFICYFKKPCPLSFQETARQFPANCVLLESQPTRFCLIIIAEPDEFHQIVEFSGSLVCKGLQGLLLSELEVDIQSTLQVGDRLWDGNSPVTMGILNITPDSFFDGGKFYQRKEYISVAKQLIEEGADIIDIGGESTRPGSNPVPIEEEIRRVLPVVEQIKSRFHIPLSVDTVKPEVAEVVLEKGAAMINDTSGLSHGNRMIEVLKKYRASYCLMHTQGTPERMQMNPEYTDVVSEVYRFFKTKLHLLLESGIEKNRICIDPGIGFGKSFLHNLFLQRFLSVYKNLGQLILLGVSNKSFIGQALSRDVDNRLIGSVATQIMGWINGASIFRVHDVQETKDALKIAHLFYP